MHDATVTGSCLCSGVGFEIDGILTPIQYCHATRCRKASGSAFAAEAAARASNFRWTRGADLVSLFEAAPERAARIPARVLSHLWLTPPGGSRRNRPRHDSRRGSRPRTRLPRVLPHLRRPEPGLAPDHRRSATVRRPRALESRAAAPLLLSPIRRLGDLVAHGAALHPPDRQKVRQ